MGTTFAKKDLQEYFCQWKRKKTSCQMKQPVEP